MGASHPLETEPVLPNRYGGGPRTMKKHEAKAGAIRCLAVRTDADSTQGTATLPRVSPTESKWHLMALRLQTERQPISEATRLESSEAPVTYLTCKAASL